MSTFACVFTFKLNLIQFTIDLSFIPKERFLMCRVNKKIHRIYPFIHFRIEVKG